MTNAHTTSPTPATIRLDLARHCIQTEIKRQYERCLKACLRSAAGAEQLEATVETLREALETLDFATLRSAHPALAGGRGDTVEISRGAGNRLALFINGESFPIALRPGRGR